MFSASDQIKKIKEECEELLEAIESGSITDVRDEMVDLMITGYVLFGILYLDGNELLLRKSYKDLLQRKVS